MRLIARERELAELCAFVAGCVRGPSVLVLEGEPGIGKTALFDAALASCSGLRLLTVRCAQAESGLAYVGLADLLEGWTDTLLPALPAPLRRALDIALLRAETGTDVVAPHTVGRAVLEALRFLAADLPVLIAIDDIQWLDPASDRALRFALRRLDRVPVNLLVTRRTTDRPLPLGIEELTSVRQDRLLVGPMDPTHLARLLEHRFGGPLPRGLVSRVLAAVAGNPLYAVELMAAQRRSDHRPGDPLPVPHRLDELLAERMGQLPARAAEPLAAVASLAAPTVALVTDALGAPARAGLNDAFDADVLRVEEGRLWFTHPLLGVAALARLRPSARHALHVRLAAVCTDAEERAHHLVRAADGPDADLATAVERGADLARVRGAPEVAAELAEAALRLTPPDRHADLHRRRVAAGYHRATAGEIGAARAHLAAALEVARAGPPRADLRWRLAMLTALDGDVPAAVGLLEAALAEPGSDPDLVATVHRKLADVYGMQGRLVESLRYQRLALAHAEATGDVLGQTDALIGIVQVTSLDGTGVPPGLLDRIAALVPSCGPARRTRTRTSSCPSPTRCAVTCPPRPSGWSACTGGPSNTATSSGSAGPAAAWSRST